MTLSWILSVGSTPFLFVSRWNIHNEILSFFASSLGCERSENKAEDQPPRRHCLLRRLAHSRSSKALRGLSSIDQAGRKYGLLIFQLPRPLPPSFKTKSTCQKGSSSRSLACRNKRGVVLVEGLWSLTSPDNIPKPF